MNRDYAVVEFVDETVDNQPLVQEVPARWLCENNKMCWWPPKNPLKEIKMATKPNVTSWQKHEVKVKKVYRDINEARQKCLVSSDFEAEEMGKHMRRKRETYKHMFRDTSHSPPPQPSSFNEVSELTTMISPPRSLGPQFFERQSLKPAHLYNLHSPLVQPLSCSEKYSSETSDSSSLNNDIPILTNLTTMIGPSSRDLAIEVDEQSNDLLERPETNNASFHEINFSIKALTDEIAAMKRQLQEVILHVKNIGEILNTKYNGKSETNKRLREILPLTNEDSLKNFISTLDEEPQLVENLKLYFNGIGGSGPKDHHGRMFKSIFTNKLGMKCSWKGQRGNIRLENANFIETCMYVLKQTWKTTDKEFEIFSQDWLRHCSQRKKREEAKNNIQ